MFLTLDIDLNLMLGLDLSLRFIIVSLFNFRIQVQDLGSRTRFLGFGIQVVVQVLGYRDVIKFRFGSMFIQGVEVKILSLPLGILALHIQVLDVSLRCLVLTFNSVLTNALSKRRVATQVKYSTLASQVRHNQGIKFKYFPHLFTDITFETKILSVCLCSPASVYCFLNISVWALVRIELRFLVQDFNSVGLSQVFGLVFVQV